MANLLIDDHYVDDDIEQVSEPLDDDHENDNEIMTRIGELQRYQPPTLLQPSYRAPAEDQQILREIHVTSRDTAIQLQRSEVIQARVQRLLDEAYSCRQEGGSEDDWSYLVVWPMLKLARKITQLKCEVKLMPLQSVQISPKSLLPKYGKTLLDKRIDFGLAIELNDDQIDQLDQINRIDQDEVHGIGPSTSLRLQTRPLFCSIEVKEPQHLGDPLVELGVWTSAAYSRWEQLTALQAKAPPRPDFPVLFGWTITGDVWRLHMIRRLPDGSRQITTDLEIHHTTHPHGVYLLLATLSELMKRGNTEFRTRFAASVLNLSIPASTSTPSAPASAPVLTSTSTPVRRSSLSSMSSSASASASAIVSTLKSRVKGRIKQRKRRGGRVEK